jgi:hypothetical protein
MLIEGGLVRRSAQREGESQLPDSGIFHRVYD